MKKFKIFLLIAQLFIVVSCYATTLEDNDTVNIYIKNNTKTSMVFEKVLTKNPSNQITITPNVVNPGETVTVSITKYKRNDVFARITFRDTNGVQMLLYVLDQIQLHMGQPVFNISSDQHHSILNSKTRNKNIGPLNLTFTQADLILLDN